jgi:hypothetical protein
MMELGHNSGTTISVDPGYQTRRTLNLKGVIKTMLIHGTLTGLARRIAALSFLVAGTATLMQAQQSQPAPVLLASDAAPAALDSNSYSSSVSSSSDADSTSAARFDLSSAAALAGSQPPPRRSYGRPNYSGGNTNSDGSEKWTFLAGAGFDMPIGNTYKYETTGYVIQGGGGRNFNKTLGVLAQFDYDHFGLQGSTINNESSLYLGATGQGFGGNNHVWSFSLNPTFTLPTEGSLGAYAVLGVGFYHKVTNFTLPGTACADPYCYYIVTVNQTCGAICHYSSNAPGFSGGFGLTYKFSRFASERFYVEARYVFMDNSQRTGLTVADSTMAPYGTPTSPGSSYTGYDAYPANSNRTTYIPITVGLRF